MAPPAKTTIPSKVPSKKLPPLGSSALTKDWVQLEKNLTICPGNFSQSHKRLKGHNQQSAAVCLVASTYPAVKTMNFWTKETLDQILEIGTNLYLKSRQVPDNRCLEFLNPTHIDKYFFIEDLKICLRLGVDILTARIPRDSTFLQKINDILTQFFERSSSGVFACQHTYFAIWKFQKFFFLFDPTEHNPQGGKWTGLPGLGFCYCIRSTSLKLLADIIIKNCPLKPINKFTIYPCHLEKMIKVNTNPPETVEGHPLKPPEEPITSKKRKVVVTTATKTGGTKKKTQEQPPSQTGEDMTVKKSVSKTSIPPERPRLESVTNFVHLFDGRIQILRASTHQRDPKFTRNNGTQSLSNAIAALTMLRQYKSKQWIRSILDEVLKLGEKIHQDTKSLPSGQVPTKVTLNDKDYSPKIDKFGAIGRLISTDEQILSLEQAIQNLLIDTDCCILNGPNIVSIWKEGNRYYMFDPDERDSNGTQVQPGEPGVACLTSFIKPFDLVVVYLSNVPKASQKNRFVLSKVQIKDYVPKAEDWYKFKALTYNKWILRGNFSQQDRRFPPETRNSQCTANATMALAYKELKSEQNWDDSTVDQVLINGDEYYQGCVNYLQETGRFKHKFLMVDELKRDFDVENKKVNLEVDDCLVNGVINAKSDTGILNLKKGFEEFFNDSEAGIVTANYQSMAVWKKDNTYYYYDSHSRNEKGVVCGFGTACVLRMVTIEDLTNALMTNLGPDRQNLYNISRVVVKLIDMTDEGVVKPPLNFYEALTDLVAILRSNSSEKDKKFEINAGKQTVPMCLAALAFNILTPSFDWTKEDVDQVLSFGDELYVETMEANCSEDLPEELNVDEVTTNNVKKELKIGANLIEMEFEDLSTGNLEDNLKETIEGLSERVSQEGKEVFQCILESELMTVSMWRDDNLIYLFDPRPRDERGQIYGKDDWSVKIVEVEEGEEENEEKHEDESQDDDEVDEMAGGDNLGEPEPEEMLETNDYEIEDEEQEGVEEEEEEGAPPVEKKGSTFWKEKEKEGKACVLRFSKVEDLVQHLLENSPPNRRQEIEYSLKLVKTTNRPLLHEIFDPEVEDKKDEFSGYWHEFKEVDHGKWILRSTRNFRDGLFPVGNRGKQAIPMCVVALAWASLYNLSKFNLDVIESILTYGDRLYTVMQKLRVKELKEKPQLELTEEEIERILKTTTFAIKDYPTRICMGEKMTIWEVQMATVIGDITSKELEGVPNLSLGLTSFFETHKFGLLQCRDYPVAVWTHEDIFYMFDPHPNGPSGSKSPVGVACITRFVNIDDLVQIYQNNLPKLGNNCFEIHTFTFSKEDCVRERHPAEKTEETVKIGGFHDVMAGKSILRGDVKLDCSKFDRGVHIHGPAIAFVALALSLNKDPETWTRLIIKEILTVGEELYNDSIDKLGDKFNPWVDKLDICQVKTDFTIGRLKVNCALRFKEQKGIVDVKNSDIPNLRQGLERFFEENSHGILIADKFILPVWEEIKEETYIYMFDPNSRSASGLPGQGGTACVMKFCNAKLASDHLMACMMDIDKTRTKYSIVPVEIVVGSTKTKKKVCKNLPAVKKSEPRVCSSYETKTSSTVKTLTTVSKTPKVGTSKLGDSIPTTTVRTLKAPLKPCSVPKGPKVLPPSKVATMMKKPPSPALPTAKPVTCPDKTVLLEVKRTMRKAAEEERRKEAEKKLALLGRNELYVVNHNEAIVRGLRSIVKDRELPVNIVAFVFMKIATDLSKWSYKQIELILETGYQLYVDSFNTYKPLESKLTLEHLLRRVMLKDAEVKIDIKKPILSTTFTKENLLKVLTNFFNLTNFCMVNYEELLVSVYFKSGYYWLFDPYSRDLNGNKTEKGCAMLMRFGDLADLVDKVVKNLGPENEEPGRFALIVVGIAGVQPIVK